MSETLLQINGLRVNVEEKEILHSVDLDIKKERHMY